MGLLGRWLAEVLRLALALALALAAMQLPALTHQYTASLLQVAEAGRRDIDARKAAARSFYPEVGDTDDALVAALARIEPSNAQSLQASMQRGHALMEAYARIEGTSPAFRPLLAAWDVAADPGGDKRAVLATALATYVGQIMLRADAVLYALAGLALGALLAETLIAAARLARDRLARDRLAADGRVRPEA